MPRSSLGPVGWSTTLVSPILFQTLALASLKSSVIDTSLANRSGFGFEMYFACIRTFVTSFQPAGQGKKIA